MTEQIEINEDNCVLEEYELWIVNFVLGFMLGANEKLKEDLITIKSKITKLNDLVKEGKKDE